MSTSAAERRRGAARRRQRGAVLLLMLLVMMLGASALLMSLAATPSRQREQRTLQAMADAREALIGFALRNGRLPRPATSADGDERSAECLNDTDCTGFLPWRSLGLAPGDGWDHLLRYSVTPAFARVPLDLDSALPTKQVAGGAAQPPAPAVILSTGARNYGVSLLGIPQANEAVSSAEEAANAVASVRFIRRPAGNDVLDNQALDDLVDVVPLRQLRQRMAAVAVRR